MRHRWTAGLALAGCLAAGAARAEDPQLYFLNALDKPAELFIDGGRLGQIRDNGVNGYAVAAGVHQLRATAGAVSQSAEVSFTPEMVAVDAKQRRFWCVFIAEKDGVTLMRQMDPPACARIVDLGTY